MMGSRSSKMPVTVPRARRRLFRIVALIPMLTEGSGTFRWHSVLSGILVISGCSWWMIDSLWCSSFLRSSPSSAASIRDFSHWHCEHSCFSTIRSELKSNLPVRFLTRRFAPSSNWCALSFDSKTVKTIMNVIGEDWTVATYTTIIDENEKKSQGKELDRMHGWFFFFLSRIYH